MNAEKIRKKLEEANEEIAKLSHEKNELVAKCREFNGKHKGKEGFEGRMREMQKKLDDTLIRLTRYELDLVKMLGQLKVSPEMKQELTENRIHLEQRAKETGERMHKHGHKTKIPWEVYEEALKDTAEKEDLEKRLEELRKREASTRG